MIPPGAVGEGVLVEVSPAGPVGDLGEGLDVVGDAVRFEVTGGELTGVVTIELPFDPAGLPAGPGEVEVSAVVRVDGSGWVPVGGEVDWNEGVVRIETDAPSDWGLAVRPLAVPRAPTPRIGPSEAELARPYVSLGDSFAAGEGLEPFEDGTDEPGVNECHRSSRAYPVILADHLGLELTQRACTRATAVNVLGEDEGLWNQQRQLEWLSEATELVTITIGGNDLGSGGDGLGYVIRRCLLLDCRSQFTAGGVDVISERIDALRPDLLDIYRQVATRAPGAETYVLGYPHLFPDPLTAGDDTGEDREPLFNPNERAWLRDKVDELNAAIEETAAQVDRVTYVDINDDPTYGFAGHELCTDDPWIIGLVFSITDWDYSLHSTAAGHRAVADLLVERVEHARSGGTTE